MFINNRPATDWGASISEKLITPSGVETLVQEGIGINGDKSEKRIYLKILVQGLTRDIVDKNISSLALEFSKTFILKFNDKPTYFKCFANLITVEETNFNTMLYAVGEFNCIEYEAEVVNTFDRTLNFSINANGNICTPAIVEITAKVDTNSLTIEGLTDDICRINNLKANKTIIINGEDGDVTMDNQNYYSNFDSWEFPRLHPGENLIKINKDNVTIVIKHKSRWN